LEPFHPDRIASRILGMGDVLSLIEKAQEAFDEEKIFEMERKLRKQEFNLEDFLDQMQHIRNMGPIKRLLEMVPGMGDIDLSNAVDEKGISHIEAIIKSMTRDERLNPDILNGSRRRRVAKGSGRSIQEVNQIIRRFEEMKKMLRQFNAPKGKKGKFRLF
jgi:signal recognition particle subunit SRP54